MFSALQQSANDGSGLLKEFDRIDEVIDEASGTNGLMDVLAGGEVIVKENASLSQPDGDVIEEPPTLSEKRAADLLQKLLYEGLLEKKQQALKEQKKRLDEAKQADKALRLKNLLGTEQPKIPTKRTLSVGSSPNTEKRRIQPWTRSIVEC